MSAIVLEEVLSQRKIRDKVQVSRLSLFPSLGRQTCKLAIFGSLPPVEQSQARITKVQLVEKAPVTRKAPLTADRCQNIQ
jgi:hypothetical protein